MKNTFIFLLTLSLCLAKSTATISATIRDHITDGLKNLMNTTPPINFPSPINSSICKQNLTCNNASQFFKELNEYLDKIKVDEHNHNTTRTLRILMGNLTEVMNYFQKRHTMTGRKLPGKYCCRGHHCLQIYFRSLQYLNRKCHFG